jgi:hypothetical protein
LVVVFLGGGSLGVQRAWGKPRDHQLFHSLRSRSVFAKICVSIRVTLPLVSDLWRLSAIFVWGWYSSSSLMSAQVFRLIGHPWLVAFCFL